MPINAYDPCLCGSGKQFKWCCQPYYPHVEKAQHQHERGQHAAAEQTLTQLVQKFPQSPQVWAYQAESLIQTDKLAEADAALQKAFDLQPNLAYGFWLRGIIRLIEGENVGALILFRKAAELFDPNARDLLAQINTRLAELELTYNRPVAARAAMERAIRQAPQDAQLRDAFNSVFGPDSHLPEAARNPYGFRPAAPARAEAWRPALESAATGRLTDALRVFESITAADPDDPSAWFNLGLVRAWLGDNPRALEALIRSLELDSDEERLTETGVLCEVLRCAEELSPESDYVQHVAEFRIRDQKSFITAITDWFRSGRLLPLSQDKENQAMSAVLLEDTPDLGGGLETPVAEQLSSVVLIRDSVILQHPRRDTLDRAVSEVQQKCLQSLSDPQYQVRSNSTADVMSEVMIFPRRPDTDTDQLLSRLRDRTRQFMEVTWARRPLKSLAGSSPLDAASHPTLRKRLPGVLRFLEESLANTLPNFQTDNPQPLYDFNRLRRKLGLITGPADPGVEVDIDTLDAAGLGGLEIASLSDDRLAEAFRAALRLDAPDLAGKFAQAATTRGSITDRYPFFNHLVKLAREEGQTEHVIRLLVEGEQADAATNEGRRRTDYGISRGQALARGGDTDAAYTAFKAVMAQSPTDLRTYSAAAESMLGRKQGARALEFAEAGLKQARAQNSRDGEQQFLELVEAAKRQGG